MKKSVNLKQRLDDLRGETAAPIAVTLQLEAEVYRALQIRARREQVSTEAYIAALLERQLESSE